MQAGSVTPLCAFIVEDDPDISQLIRDLLKGIGIHGMQFSNHTDVLAAANEIAPALIVLDRMLPGGDGIELCQQLRACPGLEEVPVVLVSALASEEDREAGLRAGARDYVFKPFSGRDFVDRVKAVLVNGDSQQAAPAY